MNRIGRIEAILSQTAPNRRTTLKIEIIDPILAKKLKPR